jgi:hypothetical protein
MKNLFVKGVKNQMKEKIVYMPWIACELRRRGFPIVRVEVNPHKP